MFFSKYRREKREEEKMVFGHCLSHQRIHETISEKEDTDQRTHLQFL